MQAILLSLLLVWPGSQESAADVYRKWLAEDVAYIITQEERSVFLALQTPEEKENFIEQFWRRRDPDPRTSSNEFREEHYRRLAYVREHFTAGIPGWRTDRGRIYIIHGPPDHIESHPGGTYVRPSHEGGGQTSVFPFEKWFYRHLEGIGEGIEVEFVDDKGGGLYQLTRDPNRKDAFLYAPNAGLTDLEAAGAVPKDDRILGRRSTDDSVHRVDPFVRAQDQPLEKLLTTSRLTRPPVLRFKDLAASVTSRITYADLPFRFTAENLRISEGDTLVPVTIALDNDSVSWQSEMGVRQSTVQVYGRVSSLGGRIVGEFEDVIRNSIPEAQFAEVRQRQSRYQRSIIVPPGVYKLTLVLKDEVSGRMGTLESRLEAPAAAASETALSSVILAETIEAAGDTATPLDAYVFGEARVVPRVDRIFRRTESLGIYFQAYNVPADAATGAPLARVEYAVEPERGSADAAWQDVTRFLRPAGEGRHVFARLVQLKDYEPGKYRVRVRIVATSASRSTSSPFELR